jgi:aminopeptidase
MNRPIRNSAQAMPDTQRLEEFASVAVRIGLGLAPQQELIITSPIEGLPLVRQITKQAYIAGASLVTTIFSDDQAALTRFQYGNESSFDLAPAWLYGGMADAFRGGAAGLALTGDDPALLAAQDPAKVARASRAHAKALAPATELFANLSTNWAIIPCATLGWARAVFPDEIDATALSRLWAAIFATTRTDGESPTGHWQAHISGLRTRAQTLSERRYSELRFRGPGTDLRVGLADDHVWAGGSATTKSGLSCTPNIPNEEVFTCPHRDRVDGFVKCTKPLAHKGMLSGDIELRFSGGKVIDVKAQTGEILLRRFLDVDEGARRLGEVALVPNSSPIARSGLLFYNTLMDENAASHIALGQAFSKCIRCGDLMSPEQLLAAGANRSLLHVDLMIGSAEVDVDGIFQDDTSEPVMRAGEFVF